MLFCVLRIEFSVWVLCFCVLRIKFCVWELNFVYCTYGPSYSRCLTFLASINLTKTLKTKRPRNHTHCLGVSHQSVSIFTCLTEFVSVQILCFSYTAYPLPVIVCRICLFDNFEKLSMLVGFSRDILKGWARGCCVHVILVMGMSWWRSYYGDP